MGEATAVVVLGVDVGGSSIKAGVVDLVAGRLASDLVEVDTPQPAPPTALANAVRDVVAKVDGLDGGGGAGGGADVDPDVAIGCTFPGRLRSGSSLAAVNLHDSWVGERPADHFERAVGRPFHVVTTRTPPGSPRSTSVRGGTGTASCCW